MEPSSSRRGDRAKYFFPFFASNSRMPDLATNFSISWVSLSAFAHACDFLRQAVGDGDDETRVLKSGEGRGERENDVFLLELLENLAEVLDVARVFRQAGEVVVAPRTSQLDGIGFHFAGWAVEHFIRLDLAVGNKGRGSGDLGGL